MLSSYTWSQDALLWSGMTENQSCAIALNNLNELHSTIDVPNFVTGCKAYHWCTDPYALGAYALFTPYQEQNIHDALGASIGDTIHFIGEHTSLAHAWVEGAVLSSMRLQMHLQEEAFDVAIIGGGPLGLATALEMARKQPSWRIAVIERFQLGNTQGSSGSTDIRQFQQAYDEWYLSDLGRLAVPMWEDLERRANLANGSLFDRTNGFLYIDSVAKTNSVNNNCQNLSLSCVLLNPTELKYNYSFISASSDQQAVLMSNSGYINVTLLLTVLQQLLSEISNVVIRENEAYLTHDSPDGDVVHLITDRGSLNASQVVFLPGPYAKNVSALLGFDLNMKLWELPTFYARQLPSASSNTPIWYDDSFAGYSPEPSSSSHAGYIRIEPHFLINPDKALTWPDQRTNKPDPQLLEVTRSWLRIHMAQMVNPGDIVSGPNTCLASVLPDGGYLLDYVPVGNTRKRMVMGAGGWAMKYVLVFADILTDLVLGKTTHTPYEQYLDQFSFNRSGRIIPEPTTTTPQFTTTSGTMPAQQITFQIFLYMFAVIVILFSAY